MGREILSIALAKYKVLVCRKESPLFHFKTFTSVRAIPCKLMIFWHPSCYLLNDWVKEFFSFLPAPVSYTGFPVSYINIKCMSFIDKCLPWLQKLSMSLQPLLPTITTLWSPLILCMFREHLLWTPWRARDVTYLDVSLIFRIDV